MSQPALDSVRISDEHERGHAIRARRLRPTCAILGASQCSRNWRLARLPSNPFVFGLTQRAQTRVFCGPPSLAEPEAHRLA